MLSAETRSMYNFHNGAILFLCLLFLRRSKSGPSSEKVTQLAHSDGQESHRSNTNAPTHFCNAWRLAQSLSKDGAILHSSQSATMESPVEADFPHELVPFRIASPDAGEDIFFARKSTDALAYSQDPFDPFAEAEASRDDDEEEFPVFLTEKRELVDRPLYNIDNENSLLESMKSWEPVPMPTQTAEFESMCCPVPAQGEKTSTDPQITWQQSSFGYSVDETMFLASLSKTDVSTSQISTRRRKHRPANLLRDIQSATEWAMQEVSTCIHEGCMVPCGARSQKEDEVIGGIETPCMMCTSPNEDSLVDHVHRNLSKAASKAKTALLSRVVSTSSSFSEFSDVEWKTVTL